MPLHVQTLAIVIRSIVDPISLQPSRVKNKKTTLKNRAVLRAGIHLIYILCK